MAAQLALPEVTPAPEAPRRMPRTRGECAPPHGARPCPYTQCRHALPRGLCSLDVADQGESTDAEVADLLGYSRARIGQLVESALAKLRKRSQAGAFAAVLDPIIVATLIDEGAANGEVGSPVAIEKANARRAVARLLDSGLLSHGEIAAEVGVGEGLVGRVSRERREAVDEDVIS